MNILKVIIDNNPHPYKSLLTEHGLCVFIKLGNLSLLFDSGASKNFLLNAYKMDICIESVNYLFLSHAHKDHSGGLNTFLTCNSSAPVFLSRNILEHQFYSYRNGEKRDISHDNLIFYKYKDRFNFVYENINPLPGVHLLSAVIKNHPIPLANKDLNKCINNIEIPDDFNHELFLTMELNDGIIVLSACSHKGILNILDTVREKWKNKKISCVIGGLHLTDGEEKNQYESPEEILSIAAYLDKNYPETMFYTGHCTGMNAFGLLKSILKDRIQKFYSGFEISIGDLILNHK